MKKKSMILCVTLLFAICMTACSDKTSTGDMPDAAGVLTEVKTTQFFAEDKVTEEDINNILSAGVNAPSAMNTQPWHFTAVTDEETTQKLADAMSSMKPPAPDKARSDKPKQPPMDSSAPKPPEGKGDFAKMPNKAGIGDAPLTIVISCEEGSELSAGLAVQNMSAEAQLLGYGTKILTSPTIALNGENKDEYKALLNIPENQKVAAVLLVGKPVTEKEDPDVVSSATTRNGFDEVVTIIGG